MPDRADSTNIYHAMLVGTKVLLPLTVPNAGREVTCDGFVAAQSKARLRYHQWTT